MTEDLKTPRSCVSCGRNSVGLFFKNGDYQVRCEDCGMAGPWKETTEVAIKVWNAIDIHITSDQ